MVQVNLILVGRLAIAAIWFYQGLWCKVLGKMPRHARVVESTPFFKGARARRFLILLGSFEALLGAWILSGIQPQSCAAAQTALLIGMNTGGLIWAHRIIPDPPGMVFQNLALLVLIWICA